MCVYIYINICVAARGVSRIGRGLRVHPRASKAQLATTAIIVSMIYH